MAKLVTSAPVLVTGASGYVGYFVVGELLKRGYSVRGTVRNTEGPLTAPLKALPGADERLTLVSMDLLDPESVAKAMEGIEYVQHVASPFKLHVEDPQKDLVTPAVDGTTNVMKAAAAVGVKKVVVTSSVAAVLDRGAKYDGKHVWTEEDWNLTANISDSPYPYSKICAEKAAWALAEELNVPTVVLNPTLVLGPAHHKDKLSESFTALKSILSGKLPVVPNLNFDVVDVREVAFAHAEAMIRADSAGRHLLIQPKVVSMLEVCQMIKKEFPDYAGKVPTRDFTGPVGSAFVRVMVGVAPKPVRLYVRSSLGRTNKWDVTKSKEKLGLEYRDGLETFRDAVASLIELGGIEEYKTKK